MLSYNHQQSSQNPEPTAQEEQAFLRRCIDGDQHALTQFVARFHRYIYTVVDRTVRRYRSDVHPTVIEDLTQEVFLALFENDRRRLRLFEGRNGCPIRAWIRVISARTTISRMRRWKNHRELPNQDSDRGSLTMVDSGPSPFQAVSAVDDRMRSEKLLQLARGLSQTDRRLIEMYFVEERSVDEIVSALEIGRGALYMRKNRAVNRLRDRARAAGMMKAV